MQLCFAFGLIFLMPAFIMSLAVDPVTLTFTSSRVLQGANLFCGGYGLAMILTSRDVMLTALKCRAVQVLIALSFLSVTWSIQPASTWRESIVFLSSSLFAMAMAGRLSPIVCLRLIIRTMAFICLLSIFWVVFFPQQGLHQINDPFQFQHAGLWRGVFTHKQGLGVVSGLTTGLLLFYGSVAFSSPVIRFGAIAASFICLIGTQSATGFVVATLAPTVLYMTYWIAGRPPSARKPMMAALAAAIAGGFGCFYLGILNFIMPLLGKSTDLTGRADFWPWVLGNIRNSGSALLGGGFAGGWESVVAPSVSIDNGYILLLVWYGYLGAAIILAVYGWIIWAGAKLVLSARSENAALQVYPFSIMIVQLILNITEPTFMGKNINTVLITVAAYQIVKYRSAVRAGNRRRSTNPITPSLHLLKVSSSRDHTIFESPAP
jgi:exopolysaccharide production protein ExoQ